MLSKKRGETIIEVMVAMTVLAIVLAGLYSVIVNVSSLMVASRDRTKAIALAQKGISEFERNIKDSCVVITAGSVLNQSPANCKTSNNLSQPCNYIDATEGASLADNAPYPALYKNKFIKVVSTVEWSNRQVGNQRIELIEMVRKSE